MQKENKNVDLSSLKDFGLEPDWLEQKSFPRDKTQQKRKVTKKNILTPGKKFKGAAKKFPKKDNNSQLKDWVLDVNPTPEVLLALKNKIKTSGICYSLKEIADVVTAKPDRLMVKISTSLSNQFLWIDKKTKKCYLQKKSAIQAILFDREESFVGQTLTEEFLPKGNLQYVLECPKTKMLLPPTSFHDFEEFVNFHLFKNKIRCPQADFVSSLSKIDDPQVLKNWKEQKLKRHAYFLKKDESKLYNNLTALQSAVESQFFEDYFWAKTSFTLYANKLENIEKELGASIKSYLSQRTDWKKQILSILALNFRRSKFCLFKKNQSMFVRNESRKSIEGFVATELASKLISVISSSERPLKKTVVQTLVSEGFALKDLILELKWLISSGYINEYSDSGLEIN